MKSGARRTEHGSSPRCAIARLKELLHYHVGLLITQLQWPQLYKETLQDAVGDLRSFLCMRINQTLASPGQRVRLYHQRDGLLTGSVFIDSNRLSNSLGFVDRGA